MFLILLNFLRKTFQKLSRRKNGFCPLPRSWKITTNSGNLRPYTYVVVSFLWNIFRHTANNPSCISLFPRFIFLIVDSKMGRSFKQYKVWTQVRISLFALSHNANIVAVSVLTCSDSAISTSLWANLKHITKSY